MTQHFATRQLRFFLTAPSPCPYLPGRDERKVFAHLPLSEGASVNDSLTQVGFRRSQNIAYRPACESCDACVSARIPTADFVFSRSARRVLERNGDLMRYLVESEATTEQFDLLRRYLTVRHAEGGMADMSVLDYAMMIGESYVATNVFEYRFRGPDSAFTGRGEGPLVATALTDVLADGLSMVYSFYDPDYADRSLGTFMILDHITRARKMGLPYVYLGYWVDGSRKMGYKRRFRPQEHLGAKGWTRVD